MKMIYGVTVLFLITTVMIPVNAFVLNVRTTYPPMDFTSSTQIAIDSALTSNKYVTEETLPSQFNQENYNFVGKEMRLKHLEEQAMYALKVSCDNHDNVVFPNAMIAGDSVITHLLHRMGFLKNGKCRIMVIDTFHLFPETLDFLHQIESYYGFNANIFCAKGVANGDKTSFDHKYGKKLWKEDIEQYDKVCKVEPFQRGLKTLKTDCVITGRTRWQGFERAWINLFENSPTSGGFAKCNPLTYWTLEDVFEYISKYNVPSHPLHATGYPSIGDAKDTIPIPEDGSTRFEDFKFVGDKTLWLNYASERKGRFIGLANKDGSTKTECGIHVSGSEKTFYRDLWTQGYVKSITTPTQVTQIINRGKPSFIVVYAPWCKFCQDMEEELNSFAKTTNIDVYKFRGDELRDFVRNNLNTESFPTLNLVQSDGSLIKFESDQRNCESLTFFLAKNS